MGDATTTSATAVDDIFYKIDESAFEIHGIIVKSLPENRKFNTIRVSTLTEELIYLRPEGLSIPENHRLLLRGPSVAFCGADNTTIIIGDNDWNWNMGLDDYSFRDDGIHDGVQSINVKDPEFPEACVQIICERIPKPSQAHFKIIFEDQLKDREFSIARGEIAAISGRIIDTKRLLRCFGDDLIKHLLPSENPEAKLKRQKLVLFPLVSGKAIDLYRSHMVLHTESELVIDLNLELEVEVADRSIKQSPLPFKKMVSFRAPADPDFVGKKDFIPRAMDMTKKTETLRIDEAASIRVEVSWFNDQSAFSRENHNFEFNFALWGYRDGDCDYEGFRWEDRKEFIRPDDW